MQGFVVEAEDAAQGDQHNIEREEEDIANHSNLYKQVKRFNNLVGLLRIVQTVRATMLRPQ